jgi:hypothetical protein
MWTNAPCSIEFCRFDGWNVICEKQVWELQKFQFHLFFIAVVLHFKVELLNFNFLGLDLAMMIMITYVSSSIFLNGHVFVDFQACLINI